VTYRQYKTIKKTKSQSTPNGAYKASIAVRVKNEIVGMAAFWESLKKQTYFNELEIVFLDSGSTDNTLEYLKQLDCNIYEIESKEFSFGDSCNLMMTLTSCRHVFFFSGHVVLESESLIAEVIDFDKGENISAYFRQIPNVKFGSSAYDEAFLKHRFPSSQSKFPKLIAKQNSFSNAASVINRLHWEKVSFKEVIFGEDEIWASEILNLGGSIYYFHSLNVMHSHNDTTDDVYKRVSMAAKVKYPNGVSTGLLLFTFIKVFIAIFVNCGRFLDAIKYAKAHTKAYSNI
jgi:glycosyltransferase involved in cell wall biosynthesis